jgi:hypothetical protein
MLAIFSYLCLPELTYATEGGPCDAPVIQQKRKMIEERRRQYLVYRAEMIQLLRLYSPRDQVNKLYELDRQHLNEMQDYNKDLIWNYAHIATSGFGNFRDASCIAAFTSTVSGISISLQEVVTKEDMAKNSIANATYNIYLNEKLYRQQVSHKDTLQYMGSWFLNILFPQDQVENLIIESSINNYPDPCPCPYSLDSLSQLCGNRSAYSIGGGRSPQCYSKDVTLAEVESLRKILLISIYYPRK